MQLVVYSWSSLQYQGTVVLVASSLLVVYSWSTRGLLVVYSWSTRGLLTTRVVYSWSLHSVGPTRGILVSLQLQEPVSQSQYYHHSVTMRQPTYHVNIIVDLRY
eukprot:scaffold46664_cov63-Attheya_sp.AAC.8